MPYDLAKLHRFIPASLLTAGCDEAIDEHEKNIASLSSEPEIEDTDGITVGQNTTRD